LDIKQIGFIQYIKSIQFIGFPEQYSQLNLIWPIESNIPYTLNGTITLPTQPLTLYPRFLIVGNDGLKDYPIPIEFRRPIILTNQCPIYDARLAASNYDGDKWKINPIKEILNIYGFDTSTLGIEVQPKVDFGNALLESEKEWASSGDCFIAILTSRHLSTSGEGVIPGWVHKESGLSYSKNRPTLAFVEKSVKIDALYNYLDDNHIIYFDPYNLFRSLRIT
jgi:hypothetical protein